MNQNREKLMQMYQGNLFNMPHDYHMPDWVDDGYNNDDDNENYEEDDDENEEIIDYANEPQNENNDEDVDDAFARLFNNN